MTRFLGTISFIIIIVSTIHAATITWDGGAGTDSWSDETNWDTDEVPTSGDIVIIGGSSANVIFNGITTVKTITVQSGGSLTVANGAVLTINGSDTDDALETSPSGTIINHGEIYISNVIGYDGIYNKGTFTNNNLIDIINIDEHGISLSGGTFYNNSGATISTSDIGKADSDRDHISVDDSSGTAAVFNNAGSITISMNSGDDGINVNDGSNFDNSGTISISDSGDGDDAITIEDASIFNNNSGGVVTIDSSPDMGITVKTNGSLYNNSGGSITIDAVTNNQIYLTSESTFENSGNLTLTNAGQIGISVTDQSTFTNIGSLNVSDSTNDGIRINANFTTPPATLLNSGTISITNGNDDGIRMYEDGILDNSGTINIITSGDDAIHISDGNPKIDNSGTINIDSPTNEGLEIQAGTFNNMSNGVFDADSCGDDGIEVNDGTINNDGDIRIDLSGSEEVETFSGFNFNNSSTATFSLGSSTGDFEIKGDLDLGSSTSSFKINGIVPISDFDQMINFSGSTLTISDAYAHIDWGVYIPNVGETFKIIAGDGLVNGEFISITSSNASISYTVDYDTDPNGVIINVSSTTPVDLISFFGDRENNASILEWITANEVNNLGFGVEHSKNGIDWIEIGYITSSENNHEVNAYSFIDKNPINGVNYYRLRQMDLDSHSAYSNTVSIIHKIEKDQLSIYPNPVENTLFIDMEEVDNDLLVELYNAKGQMVLATKSPITEIEFSHYKAGVYFLNITSPYVKRIKRIVKY